MIDYGCFACGPHPRLNNIVSPSIVYTYKLPSKLDFYRHQILLLANIIGGASYRF